MGDKAHYLWVVTGAGCFMRCSASVFQWLADSTRVDVLFTAAGLEVARLYGVLSDFVSSASRVYYSLPASGGRLAGRVATGAYRAVIIAPASANTIAKIRHGVADSPGALVGIQAIKAGVSLVLLPSDALAEVETELPCLVHHELCTGCGACVEACGLSAITLEEGRARIDYEACMGCGACMEACASGALRCWERRVVEPSPVDIENAWLLARFKEVTIVVNCDELREEIRSLLEGVPER